MMRSNKMAWWRADGDLHARVWMAVDELASRYPGRAGVHEDHARLYSEKTANTLFGRPSPLPVKKKMTLNITRSVIDSLVAHYGLERVQPLVMTEKGSWKLQRRAEKMNQFSGGQFRANKIYRLGPRIFRDGFIFGLGFLLPYEIGGKIRTERVFPHQMLFDEVEAQEGNPRFAFRVRDVSREGLLERADIKHAEKLVEQADRHQDGSWPIFETDDDRVSIVEAWRLPPEDGSGHGRYCAALTSGVLVDEPYDGVKFPFIPFRLYGDAGMSWWPETLVDNLRSIQAEINYLVEKVQRQMKASSFKIMVERNSKVVAEHLTNEDGTILYYTGAPPQWAAMQAVSPETFDQIMRLKNDAFEQEGINRLSAQGVIPPGIKSGKGQQIYLDEGAKRLRYHGRSVEDFYCDISERLFALARAMDARGEGGYSVMAESKGALERIRWQDASMEDDQYEMGIHPTNYFASTPSARIEQAREMFRDGLLTVEQFGALADMPDLAAIMATKNAPFDEIERAVSSMRDDKSAYPGPYTNLVMAGQVIQNARLQAEVENAPEGVLALFDQYLLNLEEIEKTIQPLMPPGAGAQSPIPIPMDPSGGAGAAAPPAGIPMPGMPGMPGMPAGGGK